MVTGPWQLSGFLIGTASAGATARMDPESMIPTMAVREMDLFMVASFCPCASSTGFGDDLYRRCIGVHSQLWLPAGQDPGQNGDKSWHSSWVWQEQRVTGNGIW